MVLDESGFHLDHYAMRWTHEMKKIIRNILVIIAATGVAFALCHTIIPTSPAGFWTGPDISCMCNKHHFIHFANNSGVLYHEESPPPSAAPLVQIDKNIWRWDFHDFTLSSNRQEYTIQTNRVFLCKPGWFWMQCTDQPNGKKFVLHRDFHNQKITEIMKDQPNPQTADETAKQLIEKIRKKGPTTP
ncbi:MAG: hypothetical protein PHR77_16640 [Kiritimatiellae bacterium]|nr:hypothetical protein [Kiritimatiellia bacterium]MDD5521605.1 hypothetical protein [Kiritimatiellia bacterium]